MNKLLMKITELQLLNRENKPICQTGFSDNPKDFLQIKPICPIVVNANCRMKDLVITVQGQKERYDKTVEIEVLLKRLKVDKK